MNGVRRRVPEWSSAPLAFSVALACGGERADERTGRVQTDGLEPVRRDAGYLADAWVPDAGGPDARSCSTNYGELPDDCDPAAPKSWEVDCDGDGAPGAQFISCKLDALVTGDSPGAPDQIDCDDDSTAISPLAEETWGDERDTDCDGETAPSCEALEGGSAGQPRGTEPGDCDGAQLEFGELVACPHACTDETALLFGYLVNRGGSNSTERVSVQWMDDRGDAGEVVINPGIEPGGVSSPFRIEYHYTVGLELWFDQGAGACEAERVEHHVPSERVPCIR